MTTKTLSLWQARWREYLSRFNFKIIYQLGRLNRKADALTKRSDNLPAEADERLSQQSRIVLKPESFLEMDSADLISDRGSDNFSDRSLSDSDESGFARLQSEVQDLPVGLDKENSTDLEDDVTLMDPVQLWANAYANMKDPVHGIITSLE